MPDSSRPTRSLRHEYELFVEQEIENYKESVPRSVLLGIGDEAVSALALHPQFVLTELVICEEVDRIITRRLRLPGYDTWRRRRLKLLEELRRPEHWGLRPDDVLVMTVAPSAERRVLVAGLTDDVSALYLAANGCEVTAIAQELDVLERVMQAAIGAGLTSRLHAELGDLSSWQPNAPLDTVIVTPTALDGLSADERARAIALLQSVTTDGGMHLVQTIPAALPADASISLDELRARYVGWAVSVERGEDQSKTFLARKGAA